MREAVLAAFFITIAYLAIGSWALFVLLVGVLAIIFVMTATAKTTTYWPVDFDAALHEQQRMRDERAAEQRARARRPRVEHKTWEW